MEFLSPNSADAMAFSHLELFLELLLARKYDMTPTCPQVEPIKCFTNWTRHPWNFLIQVSLFLILL